MNTYTITETQNANSTREGVKIEAANLSAAKRAASKSQCFEGTVLSIYTQNGVLLARKEKSWVNA